jgi:hypothetical protein
LTADDVGLYAIDFEGNGAMSDIVNVASGTSDVVLRLRPRARLAGTVVDAATGRPHHAEVLLTLEGDPKSESRYTSEGRFEFKLLRAGAYTLTAKAEGRTLGSTKLQLAEGETNSGIEIRVK